MPFPESTNTKPLTTQVPKTRKGGHKGDHEGHIRRFAALAVRAVLRSSLQKRERENARYFQMHSCECVGYLKTSQKNGEK
jgi:hypothetical protein